MSDQETTRVSRIEMHNTPGAPFRVEQVGDNPEIVYHVDWERMEEPSPKLFHEIGHMQVKLACLQRDYFGPVSVKVAYDDAMEALNRLVAEMADARAESEGQSNDLYMGNLEVLPEVSKEWPPEAVDQ